ncbi:ankyrin repeat-containing domain protein [Xylaria nigripes]|nr:ankyrin repeat-containing domain protein [Xylaria nigripes]
MVGVLSPTKSGQGQLEYALANFSAILTDEQRRGLHKIRSDPTVDSIFTFTGRLDREHRGRSHPVASRFSTLLESVQSFCSVIDTFISSHPEIAALIWGSIIVNYTSYFNAVSELFMEFGRLCPLFDDYAALYQGSKRLQESLSNFHAAVIRCCSHIVQATQRSWHNQVFRAFYSSFEQEFRPDKDDIRRCSDRVREAIEHAKAHTEDKERKAASLWRKATEVTLRRAESGNKGIRELQLRAEELDAENRKVQLLEALCSHHPERLLKQNHRKRFGTTTSWIFETAEFCNWVDTMGPALLWCSGKIGSGKSVIAASVVDHFFVEKGHSGCYVSYFFTNSGFQESLSAETIMRSILRQTLPLPSRLSRETEKRLRELSFDGDLDEIVKFIRDITHVSKPSYIIIDGLDECERPERLKLLKSLSSLVASATNTKLFLACRENISGDIQTHFSSMNRISVNASRVQDDIATYINGILQEKTEQQELKVGDPSLIDEIKQALVQGADGMFLWVFFQVEEVCKQPCDEDIRQTIADLPRDLEETFSRLVTRILSRGYDRIIRKILPWIAASTRPLTLEELGEAIALEIGQRDIRPERLYNDMDSIASRCENLVHVDEEDRSVQFAHHSIKKFFLLRHSVDHDGLFYIDLKEADHFIGEICVTYLNFINFNKSLIRRTRRVFPSPMTPTALDFGSGKLIKFGSNFLKKKFLKGIEFDPSIAFNAKDHPLHVEHPFIQYASTNWITHTKNFRRDKSKTWAIWNNIIFNGNDLAEKPWQSELWGINDPVILEWALHANHRALMELVVSSRSLSDKETREMALSAIKNGDRAHIDIALQHLEPGQIMDEALQIAAEVGDESIVERLLKAKAKVDASAATYIGYTALQAAAGNGHLSILNRLLAAGSDVDSFPDPRGRTALQVAAGSGHLDIVERLLAANADVNASAALEDGLTALQAAAGNGHLDIVERLLAANADVNASAARIYGLTALQAAAGNGHLDIVERLLAANADVNGSTTGINGRTALQAAAGSGHLDIVERLLAVHTDVNSSAARINGLTALQAAAGNGHLDIVERLLAANADVNASATGINGRTALQAAAGTGHLDIVERLLAANADVNAIPARINGRTALQAAGGNGHLDIVERLLAANANVNAIPAAYGGRTALQAAMEGDHKQVVLRLREAGTRT